MAAQGNACCSTAQRAWRLARPTPALCLNAPDPKAPDHGTATTGFAMDVADTPCTEPTRQQHSHGSTPPPPSPPCSRCGHAASKQPLTTTIMQQKTRAASHGWSLPVRYALHATLSASRSPGTQQWAARKKFLAASHSRPSTCAGTAPAACVYGYKSCGPLLTTPTAATPTHHLPLSPAAPAQG
jgi:hypothetical protein